MKQIGSLRAQRRTSTVAAPETDEALYDAALVALLAQAVRPPSVLDRLRQLIWSALKRFHARRRDEANRLPPEYWFWHY
jgi:hypothetical protein